MAARIVMTNEGEVWDCSVDCGITPSEVKELYREFELAHAKWKRLEKRLGNNIDPSVDPLIELERRWGWHRRKKATG